MVCNRLVCSTILLLEILNVKENKMTKCKACQEAEEILDKPVLYHQHSRGAAWKIMALHLKAYHCTCEEKEGQ